jgi:hypothetical protein
MTSTDTDEAFQLHLTRTANYHAATVAKGGTLWWLDPEKLSKLEERVPGISQLPPEERRRALFNKNRNLLRTTP